MESDTCFSQLPYLLNTGIMLILKDTLNPQIFIYCILALLNPPPLLTILPRKLGYGSWLIWILAFSTPSEQYILRSATLRVHRFRSLPPVRSGRLSSISPSSPSDLSWSVAKSTGPFLLRARQNTSWKETLILFLWIVDEWNSHKIERLSGFPFVSIRPSIHLIGPLD